MTDDEVLDALGARLLRERALRRDAAAAATAATPAGLPADADENEDPAIRAWRERRDAPQPAPEITPPTLLLQTPADQPDPVATAATAALQPTAEQQAALEAGQGPVRGEVAGGGIAPRPRLQPTDTPRNDLGANRPFSFGQLLDNFGTRVAAVGTGATNLFNPEFWGGMAGAAGENIARFNDAERLDLLHRLRPDLAEKLSTAQASGDFAGLSPEDQRQLGNFIGRRPEPLDDWYARARAYAAGDKNHVLHDMGLLLEQLQRGATLDEGSQFALQQVVPRREGFYGAAGSAAGRAKPYAHVLRELPGAMAGHYKDLAEDPTGYGARYAYEDPLGAGLDLLMGAGAVAAGLRGAAGFARGAALGAPAAGAAAKTVTADPLLLKVSRGLEQAAATLESPVAATAGRRWARWVGEAELRDRLAIALGHGVEETSRHAPQTLAKNALREAGFDIAEIAAPGERTVLAKRTRPNPETFADEDVLFGIERVPEANRPIRPGSVEDAMLGTGSRRRAAEAFEPATERARRQRRFAQELTAPYLNDLLDAATQPVTGEGVATARRIVEEVRDKLMPPASPVRGLAVQIAARGEYPWFRALAWGRKGYLRTVAEDIIQRHDERFFLQRNELLTGVDDAFRGLNANTREAVRPIMEGRLDPARPLDTQFLFPWEREIHARWVKKGVFDAENLPALARVRAAWKNYTDWAGASTGLSAEMLRDRATQAGRQAQIAQRMAAAEAALRDGGPVLRDLNFDAWALGQARFLSALPGAGEQAAQFTEKFRAATGGERGALREMYGQYADSIEGATLRRMQHYAAQGDTVNAENVARLMELRETETQAFLDRALAAHGMEPLHFPYQRDIRPSMFMPQRSGMPWADSFMRKSHAALMRAGVGFTADSRQVLKGLVASRVKVTNLADRLAEMMPFARRVDDRTLAALRGLDDRALKAPPPSPGYAYFFPEGYLTFFEERLNAQQAFVDKAIRSGVVGFADDLLKRSGAAPGSPEHTAALQTLLLGAGDADAAAQLLYDHMHDALRGTFDQTVLRVSRAPVYEIPIEFAEAINDSVRPVNPWVRLVFDRPLNFWRRVTLGLRLAWQSNNLFGNLFLDALSGEGPGNYLKANRPGTKEARLLDRHFPQLKSQGFNAAELNALGENLGTAKASSLARFIGDAEQLASHTPGVGHLARGFQHATDFSFHVNALIDNVVRRAHVLGASKSAVRGAVMRQSAGDFLRMIDAVSADVPVLAEWVRDTWPRVPKAQAGVRNAAHDAVTPLIQERAAVQIADAAASSPELLDKLLTVRPEIAAEALASAERWLGNFSKLTWHERNVLRRIFPFYGWLRFISGLALRLPVEHPIRTRVLDLAGRAGVEAELDYIAQETGDGEGGESVAQFGLPEYLRGAAFGGVTTDDSGRETFKFSNPRGRNPFSGVPGLGSGNIAYDLLRQANPAVQAAYEVAMQRDVGTGREFTSAAVKHESGGRDLRRARAAIEREQAEIEGRPYPVTPDDSGRDSGIAELAGEVEPGTVRGGTRVGPIDRLAAKFFTTNLYRETYAGSTAPRGLLPLLKQLANGQAAGPAGTLGMARAYDDSGLLTPEPVVGVTGDEIGPYRREPMDLLKSLVGFGSTYRVPLREQMKQQLDDEKSAAKKFLRDAEMRREAAAAEALRREQLEVH